MIGRRFADRLATLERQIQRQRGEADWDAAETQALTLLAQLTGIPVARWPVYPFLQGRPYGPERNSPCYALWPRFHWLRQLCQTGIERIAEALGAAVLEPAALTPERLQPLIEAYITEQQEQIRRILQPIYGTYLTYKRSEVQRQRGTMNWQTLPQILSTVSGLTNRWCATDICMWLYSPYRDLPTRPADDAWIKAAVKDLPPAWTPPEWAIHAGI